MNSDERIQLLHQTVSSVLGVPEAEVTAESSPDTISSWDSVAHLNLVMAVEEAFSVSFTPEEALDMTSVRLLDMVLAEKGS